MSPIRDITREERVLLQNVIDDIHSQFIAAVAEGRGLERSQVESFADGRIFTGARAQKLGLIDALGTLHDAALVAAQMVGIEGEPDLVYPKKKRSLLEHIIGDASQLYQDLLCIPYRFSYRFAP
jgi:protease-4